MRCDCAVGCRQRQPRRTLPHRTGDARLTAARATRRQPRRSPRRDSLTAAARPTGPHRARPGSHTGRASHEPPPGCGLPHPGGRQCSIGQAVCMRGESVMPRDSRATAWRQTLTTDVSRHTLKHSLATLRALPSNRLEALKGPRQGEYSIRINRQWRICFAWPDGTSGPSSVEIVDYH